MKKEMPGANRDERVIEGFGAEWDRFDQQALGDEERQAIFRDYFAIFPWADLPSGAAGADVGCGSGRWARVVAPRVGVLHCVEPAPEAMAVARRALDGMANVRFHACGVNEMPFAEASLDFAYSLGVLHHVPDTAAAIRRIAEKLKPGAPFLVYLYYAFDNRPVWFRAIWRASDLLRRVVCRLPNRLRFLVCEAIAALVYWPLARTAALLDRAGVPTASFPLAYYRDKSYYVMRTDALDRFGTRLEQRFTRRQIAAMLEAAGFADVRFSPGTPHWCAVAVRR